MAKNRPQIIRIKQILTDFVLLLHLKSKIVNQKSAIVLSLSFARGIAGSYRSSPNSPTATR
jgi:hypothetical protein